MSAPQLAVELVDGSAAVAMPVQRAVQMRRRLVVGVDRQPGRLHHVDGGRHHGDDGVVAGEKLGQRGLPRAASVRSWTSAERTRR